MTGTFRYYLYASALERLELIASYSEKIDREAKLQYKNLDVFGGRFHVDFQLLYERVSSVRFFGVGPESKKDNETNMTLETAGGYAIFGVNVTRTMRLSLGETLQRFDVARGGVPGLPFTGDLFPDLPGHPGRHDPRAAGGPDPRQPRLLDHADRGALREPVRGGVLGAPRERRRLLEGRCRGQIPQAVRRPPPDHRALRGLYEGTSGGSNIPFQVLPTLGGVDSLRGFAENRFFGDDRVLFNAELRAKVLKMRVFGVDAEFEVAPFVDIGKVFNSFDQLVDTRFEVTPGLGFRGLAPPSVVGHVEFAFSREGPAIYVGLDYPF